MGIVGLVAFTFFCVSGGAYGLEEAVDESAREEYASAAWNDRDTGGLPRPGHRNLNARRLLQFFFIPKNAAAEIPQERIDS